MSLFEKKVPLTLSDWIYLGEHLRRFVANTKHDKLKIITSYYNFLITKTTQEDNSCNIKIEKTEYKPELIGKEKKTIIVDDIWLGKEVEKCQQTK